MAVLLDVERPREGLSELLPLADYVVSAADFASKLLAEEQTLPTADSPAATAAAAVATAATTAAAATAATAATPRHTCAAAPHRSQFAHAP